MDPQMPEQEMDKILEECGLLEDGMAMAEKRELIQTLEMSKISAQTEEDSRLKKDEEISVLPSSPFLQRLGSSVTGPSASGLSPAGEPSPLIAQRRRPLRVPGSPDRDDRPTASRQRSSESRENIQRTIPLSPGESQQSLRSSGSSQRLSQSPEARQQPPGSPEAHQQPPRSPKVRQQLPRSPEAHQQPPRSPKVRQQPPRSPKVRQQLPRSPETRQEPSRSSEARQQPPRSPETRQEPSRSADSPVPASPAIDDSEDGSPPSKPVSRRVRRLTSWSSSEGGVPLADEASPSQPAQASEVESAASQTQPTQYYVDHEGRRKAAERSDRAVRLLELLSEDLSSEDNVKRVLTHLELEHERTLAAVEDRSWPADILASRSFQESSLPPPLDPAWLMCRPPMAAGQRPSAAPEPSKAASPAPSPEWPSEPPPVPTPREPAESGSPQVADTSRQHSRANQLLQRAIGKKPSTAPKLSLKSSGRPRPEGTAAPGRERRPGTGSGSGSDGPSPALPRLPALSTGGGRRLAGTLAGRRRPPSPPAGPASAAKQARRRPADSEEIRPAPLRLPRRHRTSGTERPGRTVVPLVTKVQTPGGLSRRPTPVLSAAVSSSSDEDSTPAASSRNGTANGRPGPSANGTTSRPGPSSAGTTSRPGPSSAATTSRPGPSSSGTTSRPGPFSASPSSRPGPSSAGTTSRPGSLSAGTTSRPGPSSTTPSSVGASATPGAAGDFAVEVQIQCPICAAFFPNDKIEAHASRCEGDEVMEIEESPSPPLRRSVTSAARSTRERTPRGQQRCRLCSELFEEGAAYLDHVDECLRKRRERDGGAGAPAAENGRWLTSNGGITPVKDGRRAGDVTGASPVGPTRPSAGAGFSPTFQRISAQKNSCIDYHNQFPLAPGGGGRAVGRRRATRGRSRRGRGRATSRGKGRRA